MIEDRNGNRLPGGVEGQMSFDDAYATAAKGIRLRFDLFFDSLAEVISATAAAGVESTDELREVLLIMAGEAFDRVASR